MKTYRSKIGAELIIPISIIVGGTGALMFYERVWIGLVIILLSAAFITHMFLTTSYQVGNTVLKIRSGFFFSKLINIDTIKEIKPSRNPINSPAASLDRIVLVYNKFDTIMISPKEKEAFINHLKAVNPNIKLML